MFDNALERFSNPLKSVLTRALVFASEKGSELITPTHLLWALATQPQSVANTLLRRAHVSVEDITSSLPSRKAEVFENQTPNLSPDSRRILEKAILAANLADHPFIGTEHLLFGFLQARIPEVQSLLFQTAHIEKTSFEQALVKTLREAKHLGIDEQKTGEDKKEVCDHCGETHEDDREASALEYFGKELTKKDATNQALPLVGRSQEIDRLATILARKTKHHPLLIGDPGVGKTAIVEGLARRIMSGKVPAALKDTRIFSVDMGSLVAGAVYRGDFEARLLDIVDDLKSIKNSVVFIDEFHTVVGAGSGGGGGLDAANILKPALARGEIRVIGATTREEYKKYIETDGALSRRLQKITVHEPTAQETITILKGIAPSFAKYHKTSFSPAILEEIVQLTKRLMPTQRFPDKAIDVLDELGAKTAGRKATREDLFVSISEQSGTPLSAVQTSDKERLAKLSTLLGEQIVGQDDVVKIVTTALLRAKLGLAPAERPLASFLFAGPSGVGKTALSKAIAQHVGHGKTSYLRLDMSEYAESHSVSRLIGSPAGYIGYKDRAQLTDSVKENPALVVVFDEFEKAHRNVHHLLLQILEEGELRDASGSVVNFRNTIIIATTNAAKELFEKQALGFTDKEQSSGALREHLEDRFSGELLNRFDALCLFKPLQSTDIQKIVRNELVLLKKRLKVQGISLTVPADIASIVAAKIERKKGGREVRHMLRALIEEPLAEKIVHAPAKKRSFSLKKTKDGVLVFA